jgi:hypothetical protein
MTEKSREDLAAELRLLEALRLEREISAKLYAIKLVEKVVFGLVALILVAVVGGWIALVVK